MSPPMSSDKEKTRTRTGCTIIGFQVYTLEQQTEIETFKSIIVENIHFVYHSVAIGFDSKTVRRIYSLHIYYT